MAAKNKNEERGEKGKKERRSIRDFTQGHTNHFCPLIDRFKFESKGFVLYLWSCKSL